MERTNRYAKLDGSEIPDIHPFTENIDLDDEGRLWVRRVTHSERTVFDVFDPEGRYVWSVDSPWSIVEF
ncbi:MAG: hypothetical protein ACE5HT_07345, partial [Gemmatimonadales bacterium]